MLMLLRHHCLFSSCHTDWMPSGKRCVCVLLCFFHSLCYWIFYYCSSYNYNPRDNCVFINMNRRGVITWVCGAEWFIYYGLFMCLLWGWWWITLQTYTNKNFQKWRKDRTEGERILQWLGVKLENTNGV